MMTSLTFQDRLPISDKLASRLSLLGLAGAVLFLYLFGIHGFLRSAPFGLDFGVFHKAASLFVNGGNPWLDLMNTGEPFSYPPHTASILAIYGFLPLGVALSIHTVLNIASIGVMVFLANRWFLKIKHLREMSLAQGAGLAVLIGNPFMAHSVFEGQLVLPATAAVLLSWHFHTKHQWLWSGIFLGLATIKPQVSILYIVWLLLSFHIRTLSIGAVTAVIMLIPAFLAFGPIDAFIHWIESLSGYSSVPANMLGSVHVVGIESYLAALGVQGVGYLIKPLSLVAIGMLFYFRDRFSPELSVNLFFVIALTFIYGHDTDYSSIMMLCSLLVYLVFQNTISWLTFASIASLLILFFPQRILREIDIASLHHTRTLIIPLCCYLIYVLQSKSARH